MSIAPGTYSFGPENATLAVKTARTGAAAKAGHNLLIHVTSWSGTLAVGDGPGQTSIVLNADAASLRVREGTGGMQALGDDDKANIEQTIDDEVLRGIPIEFRSTEVQPAADGAGLSVQGDLSLLGATRPLAFDVALAPGGAITCVAIVKQTDWGMKPYSALFGTLKVVDEVEVALDARLPEPG